MTEAFAGGLRVPPKGAERAAFRESGPPPRVVLHFNPRRFLDAEPDRVRFCTREPQNDRTVPLLRNDDQPDAYQLLTIATAFFQNLLDL
jgi:hypothetical protein